MLVRRLIAMLGALNAAVIMRCWDSGNLPLALWIPAGILAASAFLQFHRHLGSQLLVRANWWSNLLLGVIITTSSNTHERHLAAGLALATGGALLALGRRGLDDAPGAFAPNAFRATLMAILVMAMADAQSLLLFGTLHLESHSAHSSVPLLACGFLAVIGIFGIYRLKLWGVVLNFVANILIAICAISGIFDIPRVLVVAYLVTAGLQAVLTFPLWIAVARGRAAPSEPKLSKGRYALSAAVVGALVGFSVLIGWVLNVRLFEI